MSHRLNIFVIDENMDLCRDLRPWLEQDGHDVNCSPVSRVLLASIATLSPDLIVFGLSRYDGPGMVTFRKLSNHRQLRHVPIIAVSDDPDLEYEMLDVFDFQTRPFDQVRLQLSMQRLAGSRKPYSLLTHVNQEQLAPFKSYLLEHSALHFNQNNQRILERALLRRVQALQIDSLSTYYNFLVAHSENYDELNKLIGLLTVGETSFFRYRSHRDALLHYVIPQLIEKNRRKAALRIWSAGCSTGEEPYSLAILLLENFPELADWDIQILATDINKRALRHAREGVFTERSLRLMEEPLRNRYFTRTESHYQVSRQVRNLVRFEYLNLQTDPFPQNLDLLLCRNVLIYFELDTIRRIVANFSTSLKRNGFLFMGHSETMQTVSDRFQRHHQYNAFFYQLKGVMPSKAERASPSVPVVKDRVDAANKSQPASPPKPSSPVQVKTAVKKDKPPTRQKPEQLYESAMIAFEREHFGDAGQLFDQLLGQDPSNPKALVGKGLLLANQGKYSEARACCARAIKEDDLMPEAYLLRGLILDMEGFLERALVEYQKVLWLDPGFVMAYYLSAKIHDRLNDNEKKQRALRNTARVLEQLRGQETIPFSGGLSRGVFLEIVHREIAEVTR